MISVKVKICGITNRDDALACADAGADYLGFIFHPGSPRYITPDAASSIIAELPPHVTPVGVFVNAPPGAVGLAARASGIRIAQMSGDEGPDECRRTGLPVIKVFRPGSPAPGPSSYLLFASMVDGMAPGSYGGTGAEADLGFAGRLAATGRLFLAGGLHHGNVARLIGAVRPFAVDSCSGTEASPGVKHPALVRKFCFNAKHPTSPERPEC
jgi:phosphoribosylanthranilate isomerase